MKRVTKHCVFCQTPTDVVVDKNFDPVLIRLLEEKPAICRRCVQERHRDPNEKYFVYAGDIYQRCGDVHLRLWPIGSFH